MALFKSRVRSRGLDMAIKAKRQRTLTWSMIAVSMIVLTLAVTVPFWFRIVLRLIPNRYIVAYAPEFIREIAFDTNPHTQLPTAAPAEQDAAHQLLDELAPTPAATSTPLPTLQSVGGGTPQPTPVLDPTTTITPAFVPQDMTPTQSALPSSYLLTGFTHHPQGWNNCGPATITTMMSYWGVDSTQDDAANFLKPNPEDTNVSPHEMVAYVESLGFRAIARADGDMELIKRLLLAGFPVVVERGFDELPDEGWMGHYMLVVGFSDEEQAFIVLDSYWSAKNNPLGTEFPILNHPYDSFDRLWRHFNRTYLVVYRPEQTDEIASIIGADMDVVTNYANAYATAWAELNENPNDAFGWFNLGTSLLGLWRYEEAALAYDKAREIGLPWRMLWYQFGPYEAYYQVGRYDDVEALAIATLSNNDYTEEGFYYRGLIAALRGETGNARYFFNLALKVNKYFELARQARDALP